MSSYIQVKQQMLHRQVYSSQRSAEKFDLRTQLTIQSQNCLQLEHYGHQYITYNNKYLCACMLSTDRKPIIHNAGASNLQPRSISVITVQTPIELNTQHIYALDASNDLP